jgi:ABC-type multidrug transport system fused ATPase/permease subunit
LKDFYNKISSLLSRRDKQFLFLLIIFSVFVSAIETVGVSAIMPFISVANDFSIIESNKYYSAVYSFLEFQSYQDFVIFFGLLLIGFYIFRSLTNLLYFYLLSKFSNGRYHTIAYRLFENYLGRSYRDFVEKNSSDMTKTVVTEANNVTVIISQLLLGLSEVFVILFIYSLMLYMNWKITLLLTTILGLNAVLLYFTVSKKIKKEGKKREEAQKEFYKIIGTTFGNFKLLKLKSNDRDVIDRFEVASGSFASSKIRSEALQQFPRLFLEAIGFSLVVFIVVFLVWKYSTDISGAMALLSMFILGLYRLLPSVNRIISASNIVMYNYKALHIVHNDLIYEIEDLGEEKIRYKDRVSIKNLSFSYIEDKPVLKNIFLMIERGSSIAFIGESGSGKSTLVDLITGLYRPKSGSISVDGVELNESNIRHWRRGIGYIPQSIYLFDGTVAENVAFGDEVNRDRVIEVLKMADIYSFLEESHDGVDTAVGDGGVKLSGGQKQRVAIARALYNDPDILVLDEATSALDSETEERIMDQIYKVSEDKTLLIIAHRLSTVDRCDKVYRLTNGELEL